MYGVFPQRLLIQLQQFFVQMAPLGMGADGHHLGGSVSAGKPCDTLHHTAADSGGKRQQTMGQRHISDAPGHVSGGYIRIESADGGNITLLQLHAVAGTGLVGLFAAVQRKQITVKFRLQLHMSRIHVLRHTIDKGMTGGIQTVVSQKTMQIGKCRL